MLRSNTFQNFPTQQHQRVPDYIETTGPCYALRERGRELQDQFVRNELERDLDALLSDSTWAGWVAGLDHMPDSREPLNQWLSAFADWQVRVAERRHERHRAENAVDNAAREAV